MKMTNTNDDQCIFSDQCQKQFYRRVNRFEFEGGGGLLNYGKRTIGIETKKSVRKGNHIYFVFSTKTSSPKIAGVLVCGGGGTSEAF